LNSNISDKDKKDWENFLSNKEKLENKDQNAEIKKTKTVKSIDLHGCSLTEANEKIKSFIQKSFNEGIEKLLVVTGKGLHSQNEKNPYASKKLGILKYSVPDYLNKNDDLSKLIRNLSPAKIDDGGEGAFYIYLNKNNDN
tara:strand:- start:972 stop:1391 length:420 start_codon:yes stop_codon:yes gene_type:complete